MNRWSKFGWMGAVAGASLVVAGLLLVGTRTQAVAKPETSARDSGKLIVHEWGTFTSFSGSNGVQLDFRPLLNEDLPYFVFDREQQSGIPNFTKSRYSARIRMETPVTYFYTDVERTIRASVGFPKGLLTEFYPPVEAMTPKYNLSAGREPFGNSTLDWGEVHLIPTAKLAPDVQDPKTRTWMRDLIEKRILPSDNNPGNHYYHARETDSALVHVHQKNKGIRPAADYIEKFLFYRGLGRFEQPLQVVVADDGQFKVTNSGKQPIQSLFRVTSSNGVLTYSELDVLAAGTTAEFPKEEKQVTVQALQDRVAEALVREKLYPREATAMVKTWADSWFAEEGTRVFYMVPRDMTDEVLPLTISPPPDESVRVLVGRIEVMAPSVEKKLLELIGARAQARAELVNAGDASSPPIPAELLKLGRLSEPALVRIRELAKNEQVSREALILMTEVREALDKQAQGAN